MSLNLTSIKTSSYSIDNQIRKLKYYLTKHAYSMSRSFIQQITAAIAISYPMKDSCFVNKHPISVLFAPEIVTVTGARRRRTMNSAITINMLSSNAITDQKQWNPHLKFRLKWKSEEQSIDTHHNQSMYYHGQHSASHTQFWSIK